VRRFSHSLAPVDSISTLDEMLIHSDHEVEDGETVWVRSVRCAFVYRIGSGLTPDGVTVVGSAFAPGAWVRLTETTDPSWLAQPTWYIDPVNGLDSNTGSDLSHAIKTCAEWQRRLGAPAILRQATTVTFVSDVPASDPLFGDVWLAAGGALVLQGTPKSALHTGTFSTVTVQNDAINQPWEVSSGTFDWSTVLSHQIVITHSTNLSNVGARSWVGKALALGHARTAPFDTMPMAFTTPTQVIPIAGATPDTFEVRSLVSVPVGLLQINIVDPEIPLTGLSPLFWATDLSFTCNGNGTTGFASTSMSLSGFFIGCELLGFVWGSGAWNWFDCHITSQQVSGSSIVGLVGGLATSDLGVYSIGGVQFDGDVLFQGAGIRLQVDSASSIAQVGIFDATGDAVDLFGVTAYQHGPINGPNRIFGSGNSGAGVHATAGSTFVYGVKPTVTGSGGDSSVGGAIKTWGAIPFADTAKFACITGK
jgi:hypothetical protein